MASSPEGYLRLHLIRPIREDLASYRADPPHLDRRHPHRTQRVSSSRSSRSLATHPARPSHCCAICTSTPATCFPTRSRQQSHSSLRTHPAACRACAHARSPLAARPVRLGVKPDSVLDNTARLPFSLREFALPMRSWPLTFTPLIERMDYCDGYVLLSPSPMREHRHLKEGRLAGARESLEDISM